MLYGWMRSLIIYLILSGLVVNLSPGKNYRRYVNFFTGLIVIIIISEPLSYMFHISSGDLSGVLQDMESYIEENNILEETESVYDYYDMSLTASIRYSLEEKGYKVSDINVLTDEENRVLRCTVVLEQEKQIIEDTSENDIKNYISDVYNVEIDSIYIVRR